VDDALSVYRQGGMTFHEDTATRLRADILRAMG
jgi:hypothetical protein